MIWRSNPALVPLAIFPACTFVSVLFRSASGPECESSDTGIVSHAHTQNKLLTERCQQCASSKLGSGAMEDSVGGCGKEAAKARDLVFDDWSACREDGLQLDGVSHRDSYAISETGDTAGAMPTDSVGVCGTPGGARPQLFLSEALNDTHWGEDEGPTMNRALPSNDWATFSPVNSSSSHHAVADTPGSWMQTIAESGEDNPAITSLNDVGPDVSPGWQAFSLRGELAATSLSSCTTYTPAGDGGLSLDTADRTRSNEPHRNQPRDSNSAVTTDSLCRSCVAVFRHCFTGGQGATSDCYRVRKREGREGEKGSRLVAADCSSAWQCLRDDK